MRNEQAISEKVQKVWRNPNDLEGEYRVNTEEKIEISVWFAVSRFHVRLKTCIRENVMDDAISENKTMENPT